MTMISDAIDYLRGMADGQTDDLGLELEDVAKLIEELQGAAREVVASSETFEDNTDLNLVLTSAINRLEKVTYLPGAVVEKDEDFGEKIDQLIADGHDDEGVLSFLDEDEHGLLVSLIRVRLKGKG